MADHCKLHIVMFPWLAFGHIIPFLELAKLLALKGHKISFVSTPRNIERLPRLPPNLADLINFVKLALPRIDNLPENAEATLDLPEDKVKYLKIAYDGLQQPMTHFLQTSSPDWVFYDFVPYWLGPIASRLGVCSAYFSVFIAASIAFIGPASVLMGDSDDRKPEDFTVPPNWIPFKSTVAFRPFEISRIFQDGMEGADENVPDLYRFGASIQGCDLLAVRSSYEFEPEYLRVLEEIHRKPVIPVGQLPPAVDDDDGDDDAWNEMKEWLDKQVRGTVVYVAFGSESKPSQAELTEISFGLELSGLPFVLVLRKRRGSADTELIELPDGFEERTKGRGVVCTNWVPQLKILSHDSVGGVLTHSGWSTIVEAVQFGKALFLLTFSADHGLSSRLLQEKQMAYLVPRDDGDGWFTRDSVSESLRLVTIEEEGRIYRDKVKEMSGLFGDRDLQDKYVNNLLDCLQNHRKLAQDN